MQVRQYAQQNNLEVQQVLNFLKTSFSGKNWAITSKLTSEQEQTLNVEFGLLETPALPPQQEPKALPQAQTAQVEQTEQTPQQEEQPVNDAPAPIQTASNNDVLLTKSDLAAIAIIRETFGEAGVQTFLLKKRQDLIVNKATVDALRQHDEQELYEETKLQVSNQLQIRDYIKEQNALEMAIQQHTKLKVQRKEQIKKSNEVFDAQLTDLLTKQQNFNSTMELLGISML